MCLIIACLLFLLLSIDGFNSQLILDVLAWALIDQCREAEGQQHEKHWLFTSTYAPTLDICVV